MEDDQNSQCGMRRSADGSEHKEAPDYFDLYDNSGPLQRFVKRNEILIGVLWSLFFIMISYQIISTKNYEAEILMSIWVCLGYVLSILPRLANKLDNFIVKTYSKAIKKGLSRFR